MGLYILREIIQRVLVCYRLFYRTIMWIFTKQRKKASLEKKNWIGFCAQRTTHNAHHNNLIISIFINKLKRADIIDKNVYWNSIKCVIVYFVSHSLTHSLTYPNCVVTEQTRRSYTNTQDCNCAFKGKLL